MATHPAQRQGTTLNTTDLEIYQARLKRAEDQIEADIRAGHGATTLDLYRKDLNERLIAAILAEGLVEIDA